MITVMIFIAVYLLIGRAWSESWVWLAKHTQAFAIPAEMEPHIPGAMKMQLFLWPFDIPHACYWAARRVYERRRDA